MNTGSNIKIAKNTIFLSIRMILVTVISLYTSRVFLQELGVEDYGINNVVCGFVSLFSFVNSSLANTTQRFYNSKFATEGIDGLIKVFNTSLKIQALLSVLVVLLLESVGLWYIYSLMVIPESRFDVALYIFHLSVLSSVFVIMQTPFSAAIIANEHMDYFAFVGVMEVLMKLCLALTIPYACIDNLLFYGIMILVITIVCFLFYVLYCKKYFKELRIKQSHDKLLFREMFGFSGWNSLGIFACVVREQGLNMVLNLFFGPIVNAARAVAYQVSSALQGFVSNLSMSAKPQMVSSFAEGDSQRTIKLMYGTSKLSFYFLLIMAVPVCIEINYILRLWLGDNIPKHTANFIVIIMLINFINNINAPLSNVVFAVGKIKEYEITFSTIYILLIPLSYLMLFVFRIPEMAFWLYLFISALVQLLCLFVVKSMIELSLSNYVRKIVLPMIIISLLCVPFPYIIYLYMNEGIIRLITICIVTFVIATPLFYYFFLDKSERSFVHNIARNYLKKYK